jgi:hypothetical protein
MYAVLDLVEHTFLTSLKIVDWARTWKPGYLQDLYMICRISFSRNYRIEKATVQVDISLSLFITVNKNM